MMPKFFCGVLGLTTVYRCLKLSQDGGGSKIIQFIVWSFMSNPINEKFVLSFICFQLLCDSNNTCNSKEGERGLDIKWPICRQFHQRFTCAFFVWNFGSKNYKADTYLKKAAQFAFVQKRRTYNVDEIDTRSDRLCKVLREKKRSKGKNGNRASIVFALQLYKIA